MVFVEPCNLMINGEEEHWLGFIHSIKRLIRQNDLMVRVRFKKVNENVQEQAEKTNRAIKIQNT